MNADSKNCICIFFPSKKEIHNHYVGDIVQHSINETASIY